MHSALEYSEGSPPTGTMVKHLLGIGNAVTDLLALNLACHEVNSLHNTIDILRDVRSESDVECVRLPRRDVPSDDLIPTV